jgi:hypothetical protein
MDPAALLCLIEYGIGQQITDQFRPYSDYHIRNIYHMEFYSMICGFRDCIHQFPIRSLSRTPIDFCFFRAIMAYNN